jgi:hypothetical protein
MVDRWRRDFGPATFYTFDLGLAGPEVRLAEEIDPAAHDAILIYSTDSEQYLNTLRHGFAAGLDLPIYPCHPMPRRSTQCYFRPLGLDTIIYVFNYWSQFHGIKEPIQVHCRLIKQGAVLWRCVRFLPPDGCLEIDSRTLDVPSADNALFQLEAFHPEFARTPARFRLQVSHRGGSCASDHHSTELRTKKEGEIFERQPAELGPEQDVIIAQNRLAPGGGQTMSVSVSHHEDGAVKTLTRRVPIPAAGAPFFVSVGELFHDTLADRKLKVVVDAGLVGEFGPSEWYLVDRRAGATKVCGNHLLTFGAVRQSPPPGPVRAPAYRGAAIETGAIPVPIPPREWRVRAALSVSTRDHLAARATLSLFDERGCHVASERVALDPLEGPFHFLSDLAGRHGDALRHGGLALFRFDDRSRLMGSCVAFENPAWNSFDFVENNAGFGFNNLGYYVSDRNNRKASERSIKARTNTMGAFRLTPHADTALTLIHYSTLPIGEPAPDRPGAPHSVLIELFRPDGDTRSATVWVPANSARCVKLSELFAGHAAWNPAGFGWARVSCYTANFVSYSLYLDAENQTLSCQHLWGG